MDSFQRLRQARNEDRQEVFEEERSMNSRIPQLSSDSEDDSVDSRPSFGSAYQLEDFQPPPTNSRKRPAGNHPEDEPSSKMTFAEMYMKKHGYEEGKGLGRRQDGIVEPIRAIGHTKRRGLGDESAKALAIEVGSTWDDTVEDKGIEEEPLFLECAPDIRDEIVIRSDSWIRVGKPKMTIDDEDKFCDGQLIRDLLESKSVFDSLTARELNHARARANPYETIKSAIFQNRAAVKMANMDKVFGWGLSQETDERKRRAKCPVVSNEASRNDQSRNDELWYFADVCAGPGGFSEYLLWRKAYYNCHGFGFTLKGDCDFKLDKFVAGSACYFDNYYGPNEDGNVYNPENLAALEKKVKEETDGKGVHLVTCDGGFSVEGQENIQEILSKRLYLCQFIAGLALCRVGTDTSPGGNYVCKLFDIFTPFSVGLIYLMYIAFQRISLHKPVTSRPANSERYIYCEGLTEIGATHIKEHLLKVNRKLDSFANEKKESEYDVIEVIPLDIIEQDTEFMDYIRSHNETLIQKQTLYLRKYLHFAKDSGKRDKDQGKIKDEALEYWEIPNIDRKAMTADADKPIGMLFNSMASRDFRLQEHFQKPRKFELDSFVPRFPQEVFHELYNAQLICSGLPAFLLISDCKERTFVCNPGAQAFIPMEEFPKFPRKTIMLMEKAGRWVNGKKESDVLRILDAAVIGGDDVSRLPLKERLKAAEKFVKAYVCRSKISIIVATTNSIFPSDFQNLLNTLFSNPSAPAGSLPFVRPNEEERHYYYPAHGIKFLRSVKEPFTKCWSRSQGNKYYFDRARNQNHDRQEGPKFVASFWDNIAEGPQFLSWKISDHSHTTPNDILKESSAPDTVTVPALKEHIEQICQNFCAFNGLKM